MSWIIVRDGPFRYLRDLTGLEAYSQEQKDAIRFPTKKKAEKAMAKYENAYLSTVPVRAILLKDAAHLRDGGRSDWFCHYCGSEKPRKKLCTCRGAHIHARVEQIERRLGITCLVTPHATPRER